MVLGLYFSTQGRFSRATVFAAAACAAPRTGGRGHDRALRGPAHAPCARGPARDLRRVRTSFAFMLPPVNMVSARRTQLLRHALLLLARQLPLNSGFQPPGRWTRRARTLGLRVGASRRWSTLAGWPAGRIRMAPQGFEKRGSGSAHVRIHSMRTLAARSRPPAGAGVLQCTAAAAAGSADGGRRPPQAGNKYRQLVAPQSCWRGNKLPLH